MAQHTTPWRGAPRRRLRSVTVALLTAGTIVALVGPQIGPAAAATSPGEPPTPPPASRARIGEVPLGTPSSPNEITVGPDGNLWFTEPGANSIARMTPAGVLTQFPLPAADSAPAGITSGPRHSLWFTEGTGRIGRITTGGAITELLLPPGTTGLSDVTAGPDGNLWFTASNTIGRLTPSGQTTEFPTVTPTPGQITPGPDGNLWFTDAAVTATSNGVVGRVTTTGRITLFEVPTVATDDPRAGVFPYPTGITAGPDGNLWFTEQFGGKIGRITPRGTITEFRIPTPGAGATGITVGPDGDLWFTENFANRIGRITTRGVITEFHVPTPRSGPSGITGGPGGRKGRVWFTERQADIVARLDPSTVRPPPRPCMTVTASTVLTADVGPCRGDGIVVTAGHLTLDLNGHRVFAAPGRRVGDFAGIHLRSVGNVTVRHGTVTGFDAGVWIDHGSNNAVSGLDVHDNVGAPDPGSLLGDGIVAIHSPGNRVVGNTVRHNGIYDGIGVIGLDGNGNTIEDNTVTAGTDAGVGDAAPGSGTGIIVNPFLEPENPRRGESLRGIAVVGNTVTDNAGSGISTISNIDGLVRSNVVEHNGFHPDGTPNLSATGNGIGVQALFRADPRTKDLVSRNRVVGNAGTGIQVGSQSNRIAQNATDGNGGPDPGFAFDLADLNEGCDSNLWWANAWGSGGFSAPCVTLGGSGPASGSVGLRDRSSRSGTGSDPRRRR